MHRLVQVPFKKKALGIEEEEGNTKGVDQDNGPESGRIVDEFRDDTTQKDAETHTDVPWHEDGAIGSASLTVRCHIDSHILEGGPHVTIAQTDK